MTEREFFGSNRKLYTATAPGRLDVMGGIADYSGSLVLEMPIKPSTTCTFARRSDRIIRIHSTIASEHHWQDTIEIRLADILGSNSVPDYAHARQVLNEHAGNAWGGYPIGCMLVLMREKGVRFEGGDFWIHSNLPPGKGVSASAALEVAVMSCLARAYRAKLGKTELPTLCQRAENLIVGAPCGLMDQLTCYLGKREALLPILCQPAQVESLLPVPASVHFVGIDSGVRHAVSGSSYTAVRVAAFMGYSMIAQHEGATVEQIAHANATGVWGELPFGGYLANIPVSIFESKYRALLPTAISGHAFLDKVGCTTDKVTAVIPQEQYDVLACTRHPIYENHRAQLFQSLLRCMSTQSQKRVERTATLEQLGELMYQSHASYSACGLGSEATDLIVDLARQAGPAHGVFGAKITGGGSGGTVCLLCDSRKGVAAAKRIAERIGALQEEPVIFFQGSSDGTYWRERVR